MNLSGGQKQRLALARGILAARAQQMVSALHRLHLLQHFDYVYVLDRGCIIAEGSLEYLRVNSAAFQELWRHQEEKEDALLFETV